jgi:GAF domain-containing protein/HAMP domain-containing protein
MTILNSTSADPRSSRTRSRLQAWANLSLLTKLILSFLVVTLLAVGAIAFFNNLNTTAALTDQVGRQMQSQAHAEALNLGSYLAARVKVMRLLAESDLMKEAIVARNNTYQAQAEAIKADMAKLDAQWMAAGDDDPLIQGRLNNSLGTELRQLKVAFPDLVENFVTDRYGGLLASTGRTSDYYQADEGWWQAAFNNGQGAVYIGEPEFDESSQTLSINMAVPVRARDSDEVIGILRTTANVTGLVELMQTLKVGTVALDLLYPSGQLFAADESAFEPVDPATLAQIKAAAAEGRTDMLYQGTPSLIGLAPVTSASGETAIDNLGWTVIIEQSKDEALAIASQQTRNTAGLAVFVALLAGAIAVVLGRQLVSPIAHLTNVTARISAGDLAARASVISRDEVGTLATGFNAMADRVSSLLTGLQARTRALETSAEVSRRLSTILDQKQLVAEVVEQLQQAFDYYHVHIYLADEASQDPSTGSGQALVMAGGTGEAGRAMLAGGHKLPRGKGVVGRAAETKAAVLVPDVSQDEGWLPNPLLPDTRSEIAVPIAAGEQVLGVLDVQHNVAGGLDQADADLLQSIAGQVAIALQNTRLFAEAQRKAEREARLNLIAQRIQNTATVEDALKVAVREVGQALGAPETCVRLGTTTQPGNGRQAERQHIPTHHPEA